MRTARLSLSWTLAVPRSLRFVCVDFLVRMWRLNAWPRLIDPPGRTLNRFAADFFDFIFGTTLLLDYPCLCHPAWAGFVSSFLASFGGFSAAGFFGPFT